MPAVKRTRSGGVKPAAPETKPEEVDPPEAPRRYSTRSSRATSAPNLQHIVLEAAKPATRTPPAPKKVSSKKIGAKSRTSPIIAPAVDIDNIPSAPEQPSIKENKKSSLVQENPKPRSAAGRRANSAFSRTSTTIIPPPTTSTTPPTPIISPPTPIIISSPIISTPSAALTSPTTTFISPPTPFVVATPVLMEVEEAPLKATIEIRKPVNDVVEMEEESFSVHGANSESFSEPEINSQSSRDSPVLVSEAGSGFLPKSPIIVPKAIPRTPMNVTHVSAYIPPTAAKLSQTTSRGLFEYSGAIDVDAVKATSNPEDLLKLRSSISSNLGSVGALSMAIDDSESEEDSSDLEDLFRPKNKRHCGSSSKTKFIHTPGFKSTPSKVSSSYESTDFYSRPAASTGSRIAPVVRAPVAKKLDVIDIDDELERLLDEAVPNQTRSASQQPVTVTSASSSAAREALRSLDVDIMYTRMATEAQQRQDRQLSNMYAHSVGNSNRGAIRLNVFVRKEKKVLSIHSQGTLTQLLGHIQTTIQLPILLSNEAFFFKMTGLSMDMTTPIKDLPIGDDDTLTLAVKRDDVEVVGGLDDAPEIDLSSSTGAGSVADSNKITIKARFSDGTTEIWRLGKDEPISKIAKAASEILKVPVAQIKVQFDGETLQATDTPADYDMEDDDMVDIVVKKNNFPGW